MTFQAGIGGGAMSPANAMGSMGMMPPMAGGMPGLTGGMPTIGIIGGMGLGGGMPGPMGGMTGMQMPGMMQQQAPMASMMATPMCMTPMMMPPMMPMCPDPAQKLPQHSQDAMKQMQDIISNTGPGAAGAAGQVQLGSDGGPDSKMAKYQKLVRRKQKDNANVVFVGGLRKTTEEDRVCAHFAKFGQVEHVDIKRLPDGTSRGFAFIKFAEIEAVEKVIDAHAKHMIDNKWVEVKRHDGKAACAGMATSLQKKVEDETPAPKDESHEEWSEQWSEQYLQMATQLGNMEGQAETNPAASQMIEMMTKMGVDANIAKKFMNMMSDPRQLTTMFGMDFDKMASTVGLNPDVAAGMVSKMLAEPGVMMTMMTSMMMNPMMMGMNCNSMDPSMMSSLMGMNPSKMAEMMGADPSKMATMMGMDPTRMASMMAGMMGMESTKTPNSKQDEGAAEIDGTSDDRRAPLPPENSAPPPPAPDFMPAQKLGRPGRGRDLDETRAPRRSPSRSWSRDSNRSVDSRRRRSPSYGRHRRSEIDPGAQSHAADIGSTLSSMLGAGGGRVPEEPAAQDDPPTEDHGKMTARKAAASAAAAAFLQTASKVAETSRDAARDAATARAAAPAFDGGDDLDHPNKVLPSETPRQPVRLWLPEPKAHEPDPSQFFIRPDTAPNQQAQSLPPKGRVSPQRRRSRSRRRRSRSGGRRRGGWDASKAQVPSAPAPQPMPSASCQVAATSVAQPSRPALPPGTSVAGGAGMMRRPTAINVPVNRFGVPEATPEALAAAVFRAQQVESAGLEAIRSTGQIPRGPPDLPTGTEVIEQKCVAYLIGKGGQALAAINAAAGVSIQIDQSTKGFGWSMANIYGTEEGSAKAKMILRQKVSEYRPLRT